MKAGGVFLESRAGAKLVHVVTEDTPTWCCHVMKSSKCLRTVSIHDAAGLQCRAYGNT